MISKKEMPFFDRVDEHNFNKVKFKSNLKFSADVPVGNDFRPAKIISDKMVLQRNAVNRLWGRANFEGEFAVVFGDVINYGIAKNGEFNIYIEPIKENAVTQDLVFINNRSKLVIKDVLVGEVILCAGQSNMAWTLKNISQDQGLHGGTEYPYTGGKYIPKEGEPFYEEWLKDSDERQAMIKAYSAPALVSENKFLRIFKIDSEDSSPISQEEYKSAEFPREYDDEKIRYYGWEESAKLSNEHCSAIAFYFGTELNSITNIPIAIVITALCGTLVSSWTPNADYKENKDFFRYGGDDALNSPDNAQNMAARCFNMFIAPIKNYKFKAVLWYQGETQDVYWAESMRVMINAWRREFDSPQFPFLVYQIARTGMFDFVPEDYGKKGNEEPTLSITYFNCREEQRKLCNIIENCCFIINLDSGDYDEIHFFAKKLPGQRGAVKFAEFVYGAAPINYPEAISLKRKENNAIITFDNKDDNLIIKNNGRNFEVSEDGVNFFYATAGVIDFNKIEVVCNEKIKINFVRYGALNYPKITRHNVSLYLSLFTTGDIAANQFLIKAEN